MVSLKESILAAILIGMVATQYLVAAEAGLVSAYSDISRVKCAASGKANGDDAPVTYRCKMLDELTLIAVYEGAVVRLSVLRNGEDTGADYDVGKKLEWRGRRRDKKFEPVAAILRLIEKTGYNSYAFVLAVLGVEEGKICPAAWLDVGATPHANAVARQVTDDADGKFHCGIDAARINGKDTELVQEAIARTR
jgi:hypothetical protein